MATALQLPTGTYQLDQVHSTIGFAVKHMVSRFRGSFADYDASLTVGEDGAVQLTGSAKVASVQTKDPNLTGHLQSPDFFDAEQFPEISFHSTSIRIDGEEVVLDGEMTIKGHTNPIEARGTVTHVEADPGGNGRVGVDLETVIDRHQYGIDFNAPLPKGGNALGEDVTISVELEFVKSA
jgi:polyisoprenoid-binding protein YceI